MYHLRGYAQVNANVARVIQGLIHRETLIEKWTSPFVAGARRGLAHEKHVGPTRVNV